MTEVNQYSHCETDQVNSYRLHFASFWSGKEGPQQIFQEDHDSNNSLST